MMRIWQIITSCKTELRNLLEMPREIIMSHVRLSLVNDMGSVLKGLRGLGMIRSTLALPSFTPNDFNKYQSGLVLRGNVRHSPPASRASFFVLQC